jgi:cellulose synthase/poly-beta-1,6-N-acetylglucosamine synthase-like glycosyltransferase
MPNLTILISCCEEDQLVEWSIRENYAILFKYPIIVVDKKGGTKFLLLNQQRNLDIQYFAQNTSFWFARRFGLEFVKTEYVLCLDVDTILPAHYIEDALRILESESDIGAIALDYAESYKQGHLAFGTSIWRTELLKELYDWRLTTDQKINICECRYMWDKLKKKNMKIETLPLEAIHLKGHYPRVLSSSS